MKVEELSYSSDQDDVYRIRSFPEDAFIDFLYGEDFFLIENRQPDERWNKGLPGGLLIWHIKDVTGRYSDWIDLIEADGSNLNISSMGMARDPFPGSTGNTNLTDFTSPSSRRWNGNNSNVLVTNISTSGLEMTADLSPFWVGTITESTTWSGTVRVGGDVTVPTDVTLEIAANTVIQFIADTDDTDAVAGEMDTDRSELIVQGTLRASAGGITFRSTHDDPDDADWYGIRVLPGGYVDLSNASLYDGVLCVSNEGGSLTLNDNTTFDNCGTLLWISGNPTPTFPENRETQEVVATYTAQDAGGNAVAVAWSLAVNPSETFTINNEGQLLFQNSPDFEDLNGEPTYHITIQAEDSQSAAVAELKVTVTVENENEEGMVTVMPTTPRVDEELKATLKDLDGVVSETTGWIWSAKSADEITTFVHLQFSGETSHYTPEWSDVGQVLQVQVSYTDGHGADKMEISAPTAAVVGPELVGRESLTFVEHGTFVEDGEEVVPTYTVSGVDGTATWSLDGTDAGAFDLAAAASGGVSLSFSSPPNFEDPTDTDKGGPNTYHVTIVATLTAAAETAEEPLADLFAAFQNLSDDTESAQASSSALTQAVVVTVENGDDPGVVELLPAGPPRVGHSLTARLVDEDEDLTDMVWTWLADGDVVRPASPSGETTDGYEPQPEDEGRALQTQVRYKDPFGAKTVVSAPTAAVLPAGVVSLSPNPPRLCQPVTAELSGPEEVTGETWTWERQRQGSDKWDLLWSSSSPDKTASDSDLAYLFSAYNRGSGKVSRYQPTEEDLDRVLRATVSWDGHEASDRAPVGASAPGLPRHLEGEGRAAKVVLSWRTPNNCGSAITGYEYQYRRYGATAWEQAWTPIDGSAATTSHTVDGLELGALYTLEVRAVNDEGEGAAARTQATAECPPPVIAGPPTLSVSENRVVQLARYTVEDTRCGQPNWSLAGPDARHFSLFQRKLTLKRGLNYEQPQDANLDNHYQLQVVAHDKHDPSEEDSLDVEVEVTDVNEPLVLYGAGSLAIPENWTGEITTYTAADPEGATVYWKLKGPDASLFRLAISSSPSATAYLHLDRSLNFESPISADRNNAYQLYIEASDGLHTDTIQVFVRVRLVTVRVTDVNERPWVQGPSRRSFAENDTGFVSSFYANDPEGDSLGWSLGGAAGHFRINGIGRSSSRLHVVQPMDYEAVLEDADGERAYGLDVQASDGSLSGSMRTKVVVLDVNEPPELEGPSGAAVDENSRAVADYRATDPERTNITWSLSGPNATAFRLSGSGSSGSGSSRSLYFYQAPDYELDPRSYAVSITAQDATGLSATLAVSVSVLDDVNESSSPPIDLPGEDPGSVSLNPLQPREGEAVTATLRDPDGDITDTQWTWQSGGTTVSTTDSYEPMAGDVGQVLQVQVSYQDGEGSNTDQASATSAAVLGATEQASCVVQAVEGSSTVSHPEGGTESVASYTARVSDSCGALSWSLSGSDAGSFQLRGSTLYFNTGPAVGSYAVTITAEDDASGASAALPVSVTVVADDPGDPDDPTPCNPNQLGSIDLTTTQPQVGQPITAILTDPDGGVRNVRWSWLYFSNTLSNQVAAAEDYPELDSFTPSVVLEGIRLQATALYDDACLNNQRAKSVKTDPVQPAAGKPVVRRAPPPVSKLTALAAPNPFNPHTSLHLALPGRGRVELTVYNMAGQIVRTVVDGSLEAGYHTVHWDGRDQQDRPVTSGVYLYRLRAGHQVVVGKMALIR